MQNIIKMLQVLVLSALAAVFLSACGGGASVDSFSRKRADGKIPVHMELIREEVIKELTGTPEEIAEKERWQAIELDFNDCRLQSAESDKGTADEMFNLCMSDKGYLYLDPVNAERLHWDIEEQFDKAKREGKDLSALVPAKPLEEYAVPRSQKEKDAALVNAAELGNVKFAKALLDARADANAQDDTSRSALYYAAWKGHAEIVHMLLDAGANPNIALKKGTTDSLGNDIGGKTPLMIAAQYGHTDVALILINARAIVNTQEINGWTALIIAAENGDTDTTRLLIDAGANVNQKNNHGSTALMGATYSGHADVVRVLIEAGVGLEIIDNKGSTALSFAIYQSKINVAKILLEADANPNHVRNDGYNIMDTAFYYNHPKMVKLLRSYGGVCRRSC